MNWALRTLYEYRILKFTEKKLALWDEKGKVDHLIFASRHAFYDLRLICVHRLSAYLHLPKVVDRLLGMVSDGIDDISAASVDVLLKVDNGPLRKRLKTLVANRAIEKERPRGVLGSFGDEETRQSVSTKWEGILQEKQRQNRIPGSGGAGGV